MTRENYVLDQATINRDGINKNLLLEWIIDWHRKTVYNRISKSLGAGQPTMKNILTALETLEESEQIKQQIEIMKGKDNKRNDNRQRDNKQTRNGPNGKCRKEGHDHLWKDFPDKSLNKSSNYNQNNRGRTRENNANERTRDNSGERTVTFEGNKYLERVEDPEDWDERSFNFIACESNEEEETTKESADNNMPAWEEHKSSEDATTLEYITTANENSDYTFAFKKENEDKTFVFKGIDKIDPLKMCNIIYSGEEESSQESDDSYASMPGLFQPADSNDE